MELAGLVRYYMQIKGNFDLTVIITGVGIPTTLREIDWPKASFAKASFSQFWSTIPSQACQLLEIRTWVHETWGKWRNERNVQWTLHKDAYPKWKQNENSTRKWYEYLEWKRQCERHLFIPTFQLRQGYRSVWTNPKSLVLFLLSDWQIQKSFWESSLV